MTEDLAVEIRDHLEQRAREGFDDDEAIIDGTIEMCHDEHPDRPDLAALVRSEATAAFDRLAREQEAWPVPTDCDRLDRAFAALERGGIVARQNFTCCQTCGHAEIPDEVAAAGGPDVVRGYTFFHVQDTESAAAGHGLCLAYGAVPRPGMTEEAYRDAAVAIGQDVVRALQREGLAVTWNGDFSKRIEVALDWKRRRARR